MKMKRVTVDGAWMPAVTRTVQDAKGQVRWVRWESDGSEMGTATFEVLPGPSVRKKYQYVADFMLRRELMNRWT